MNTKLCKNKNRNAVGCRENIMGSTQAKFPKETRMRVDRY
jgi:hypothetical protein